LFSVEEATVASAPEVWAFPPDGLPEDFELPDIPGTGIFDRSIGMGWLEKTEKSCFSVDSALLASQLVSTTREHVDETSKAASSSDQGVNITL
jgi:hypothetical protein